MSGKININIAVKGYFKIEAGKRDGSRRIVSDWFPNLITNSGLDLIGQTSAYLLYCKVGTGSATPDVNDTSLQTQVAQTNNITGVVANAQPSSPYYGSSIYTYRFAEGAAAGNLSEIGIGTVSGLFSRALILDGDGNPTTITILADEFLDVTYEYRQYPSESDSLGTITIGGIDYDYTIRAAQVTDVTYWSPINSGDNGSGFNCIVTNGAIGPITGGPSGTGLAVFASNSSYSNGSYVRNFTASFGLTDGNLSGGISAMQVRLGNTPRFGAYQIGLSASIPKDATNVLSLSFRCSWARKTLP